MKHLAIYLVALLTVNTVQAEEMKPARIQGKIKDFAGGNVLMYYNEKIDTLSVEKTVCSTIRLLLKIRKVFF